MDPRADTPDEPIGLDLARLTAWMDAVAPGLRHGALSATLIAGGKSNLTYRLTDGSATWALRRPPLGHVLPTAHDMAREFRVISALGPTPVPVPEALLYCADVDVAGQPFYVMSYVDGVVLTDPAMLATPEAATRASEQLVDTLLALHRLEPAAIGLGEFGRPEGYRQRQVARWHKQFLSSWDEPHGLEAATAGRLADSVPPDGPVGVVHGDYRLTNVMFRPDFAGIAAVVDWEMATVGDPLTDVGLLYVYHELAAHNAGVMAHFGTERGYLSPQQLVARYAEASGLDLADLDWYIAFGYFKLAVIAAGIHARFRQGLTVGAGFDTFGEMVGLALAGAQTHLKG